MRTLIAAIALVLPLPLHADEMTLFTVGSGDVAGSYYAAALAICDLVNRGEKGALRCSPDPTVGSIYNLEALRRGQIDFALVQSDLQRAAFDGTGHFASVGPMQDLRSVMSLYAETLTLIVGKDVPGSTLADLRGKRIDIGPPSSGRRATVDRVLATLGYGPADFAALAELPQGVAIESICSGSVDATLLVVGHPNAAVGRALGDCGARLIALSETEIDQLLQGGRDLRRSSIAQATYPGQAEDTLGIAVTATIVTRAEEDPVLVQALVRDTLSQLDVLAQRAPVMAGLEPRAMRLSGLSAPPHPGATAAFDAAPLP